MDTFLLFSFDFHGKYMITSASSILFAVMGLLGGGKSVCVGGLSPGSQGRKDCIR